MSSENNNNVFSMEETRNTNGQTPPVPPPPEKQQSGQFLRPLMTSLIAAIGSLILGTTVGYSSLAIEDINSRPTPFHVNNDEYSWFASLNLLGCIPGCLCSTWLMDVLGRKLALMIGSLPVVVGWVIIVGAPNVGIFYTGRVITGVGCGILLPIVGVYISETVTRQQRGRFCTLQEMAVNVGVLFSYIAGDFLPWTWLGIACASWACILVVATAIILPESPRWLLYKGRRDEAIEALVWLRRVKDAEVTTEITEIQNGLKNVTNVVPWSNYFQPPLLKYFALSMTLFIFYEFSGIQVLRIYTITIFDDAAGGHLPNNIETILVGVLMVFGTIICTLFVDRVERKTLLVISAVIMCISMCALGAYFKVLDIYPNFATTNLSSWLPLLSMVLATVGYEIGCGPLPHIMTSEWFSTQARARANGAGCIVLSLSGFLQAKFFPDISNSVGLAGAFWISAGICLLEAIIGFLMIPKTRNKTLETIQQDLGQ